MVDDVGGARYKLSQIYSGGGSLASHTLLLSAKGVACKTIQEVGHKRSNLGAG